MDGAALHDEDSKTTRGDAPKPCTAQERVDLADESEAARDLVMGTTQALYRLEGALDQLLERDAQQIKDLARLLGDLRAEREEDERADWWRG